MPRFLKSATSISWCQGLSKSANNAKIFLKNAKLIILMPGPFKKCQTWGFLAFKHASWQRCFFLALSHVHYIERWNLPLFTISRVAYEVKIPFCEKCSLYRDVHYIEYSLYRESTVIENQFLITILQISSIFVISAEKRHRWCK